MLDEVEDGGRARVVDEAISALVFEYARAHRFLEGITTVDYDLLRTIKDLTAHLEVHSRSLVEWQSAIIDGFRIWRPMVQNNGGVVLGNLDTNSIEFRSI